MKPEESKNSDGTIFLNIILEQKEKRKDSADRGMSWKDFFEYTTKILTPIISISGLLIGIYQYNNQKSYDNKMEFKRKIWEKQLESYNEVIDITSKISTENNPLKVDSLFQVYERLYWGRVILFEDSKVESSLKEFREILNDKMQNKNDRQTSILLKKSAYKVVSNCRRSIYQSWLDLSN